MLVKGLKKRKLFQQLKSRNNQFDSITEAAAKLVLISYRNAMCYSCTNFPSVEVEVKTRNKRSSAKN